MYWNRCVYGKWECSDYEIIGKSQKRCKKLVTAITVGYSILMHDLANLCCIIFFYMLTIIPFTCHVRCTAWLVGNPATWKHQLSVYSCHHLDQSHLPSHFWPVDQSRDVSEVAPCTLHDSAKVRRQCGDTMDECYTLYMCTHTLFFWWTIYVTHIVGWEVYSCHIYTTWGKYTTSRI